MAVQTSNFCIRERSLIFKQHNMGQLSLNSREVTRMNFTSQKSVNLEPKVPHTRWIIRYSGLPYGIYTDLIISNFCGIYTDLIFSSFCGIIKVTCSLLPVVPCLLISGFSEAILTHPTKSDTCHIHNNENRILCYSYCAHSYINFINQWMYSIKYKW